MPASVREKLNPNTVRKDLSKNQVPHSQLSARALDSFAQTRAADVSRDYQAGSGWHRAVQGLAALEPALTGMLERKLDRDIEEGVAIGRNIFTNSDEEERNRQTFKKFTEAHPEFVNDNPYVWKGWEAARLNSIALDYDKGLQDMYTNSGLQNEKDPAKVTKAVDAYNKEFRQQYALDSYENPLDLAKNFTQHAAQSRANLLSRHSGDVKAQAETGLIMATMDKTMKQVELMVGPAYAGKNGTPNIGLASQQGAAIEQIHAAFVGNLNEAAANGVRNDKLPTFYSEMVFSAYHKYGENPAILQLLDREINGITPSSLPDVAKKVNQIKEARASKAFSEWSRGKAYEEYNRKKSLWDAQDAGYRFVLNNRERIKEPLTPDTPLDDKGTTLRSIGISPTAQYNMLSSMNAMQEQLNKSYSTSPANQDAVNRASTLARMNLVPVDMALNLDKELHTSGDIAKLAIEAGNKNTEDVTSSMKTHSNQLFKALTGMSLSSSIELMAGAMGDKGLNPAIKTGMDYIYSFQQMFLKEIDDYKMRNNGRTPDKMNLELIGSNLTREIVKNREKYGTTTLAEPQFSQASRMVDPNKKAVQFLIDNGVPLQSDNLSVNQVREMLSGNPAQLKAFDAYMSKPEPTHQP